MSAELAKKCLKRIMLVVERSDPTIASKNQKISALFRFYSHGSIKTDKG